MALVYIKSGNIGKARECMNTALSIAREINNPEMEAVDLENLEKLSKLSDC